MENNFDLKSSTIDKALEIAKSFVDKLIMPSVEETGLLVKDQVTLWRFKNQIKMLNKANDFCVKHKIEPKKISLKVLSPLLEYSSLEEEDEMQEKWSILLSNLIDSEQNIENHVFPYILSQLSKDEYFPLEKIYDACEYRRINTSKELDSFKEEKELREKEIRQKIQEIETLYESNKNDSIEKMKLRALKRTFESEIRKLDNKERMLLYLIVKSEVVPDDVFRGFELSNLIRLGLVKEVREFYAESQILEIPVSQDEYNYNNEYTNVNLDIDMDSTTEFILTELGELFFKACREKNKAIN